PGAAHRRRRRSLCRARRRRARSSMSTDAVVLVGMSIADAVHGDDLRAEARRRGATVAYLQQADPSLSAELTRLADLETDRVPLVGVSLGPLAPAHSWLRRLAAYWWRERVTPRPRLDVATRLAASLHELDGALTRTRPITGSEPVLTSAAWESVTAHRHQLN